MNEHLINLAGQRWGFDICTKDRFEDLLLRDVLIQEERVLKAIER